MASQNVSLDDERKMDFVFYDDDGEMRGTLSLAKHIAYRSPVLQQLIDEQYEENESDDDNDDDPKIEVNLPIAGMGHAFKHMKGKSLKQLQLRTTQALSDLNNALDLLKCNDINSAITEKLIDSQTKDLIKEHYKLFKVRGVCMQVSVCTYERET